MTLEEKNIFRVPESTVYSSINVYKWVLTVYFINIIFNEKEKSKQKHPFLKLKFLLCKKKHHNNNNTRVNNPSSSNKD